MEVIQILTCTLALSKPFMRKVMSGLRTNVLFYSILFSDLVDSVHRTVLDDAFMLQRQLNL